MSFMGLTDEVKTHKQRANKEKEQEIIQLKAVNRMLVAACYEALELRGLMLALNDQLALDSEKAGHRTRWKQIELSIRAAIERADSLEKGKKKGF